MKTVTAIFLAFMVLQSAGLSEAATEKPFHKLTDSKGRPPAVSVVELLSDSLRVWAARGVKNATVVYVGELPGISGACLPETVALMKKGAVDELLLKPYPTSRQYPVTPVNFLSAASRAGMVKKVYWVPPTKVSVGRESIRSIGKYFGDNGVPEKELNSLWQTEKEITGRLDGIEVHVTSLDDLPKIKEETVLVVDLSFFPPLYQDEIKTPFLGLFLTFVKRLSAHNLKASTAVISCSTAYHAVSLECRFLANYLKTYLTSPDKLQAGPPQLWTERSRMITNQTLFQSDEMLDAASEEVGLDPADGSAQFDLAKAYLVGRDTIKMKAALDKAVSLDHGYYLEYLEMARYFRTLGFSEDADVFMKEAEKVEPADPRVYEVMHDVYFADKKYAQAAEAILKQTALGFDSPELTAALADTYWKGGQLDMAEKTFIKAISMIEGPMRKEREKMLLDLASVYEQEKKIEKAISTFDEALTIMDDGHAKDAVESNLARLREEWGPFIAPSTPSRVQP